MALFALLCVASAERAAWQNGESAVHADHPGKCWSAAMQRELAIGEQITDNGRCELIRCASNLRFQRKVCVKCLELDKVNVASGRNWTVEVTRFELDFG